MELESSSIGQNIEQTLEQKKEKIWKKIFAFLKNPYHLALVGILLFAFAVRLYYFLTTMSQPLWWDEAVYGTLAKNSITHIWDGTDIILHEPTIRPPLFSLLWAFLLLLGANEPISRFFLEFLPSIFTVFFVYLIGKELYDEKIGLISAFIFSGLWIHLFYTARLLTDSNQLILLFPSFYFFIKFLKSESNFKYFTISIFLLSLASLTRFQNGIFFFVYFILLIPDKKLLLKKSKFWTSWFIGLIPMFIFFISNQIKYGNIFPAFLGGEYLAPSEKLANPIGWKVLSNIQLYLSPNSLVKSLFFIFFLIGIFIVMSELVLGYNLLTKNRKLKNHLFIIFGLVLFYAFFVFFLRSAEDRWLLPTALPLTILSAIGIMWFFETVKKHNKYFAIAFIILILIAGAYTQIKFADMIIENKKTSYLQIRQGFEWLRTSTSEDTMIAGSGIQPYAPYYAERKYMNFPDNESEVGKLADADYLVVHGFTPQSDYVQTYLSQNQNKWTPIKVYFLDPEQQQPILVIYQKN